MVLWRSPWTLDAYCFGPTCSSADANSDYIIGSSKKEIPEYCKRNLAQCIQDSSISAEKIVEM
jgi:hypothetical protein